jgi:uncharacterized protein
MTVESPCIRICRLDPAAQVCVGCQRTVDEIARWSGMTEDQQRHVLQLVEQRRRAQEKETKANE